MKKKIVFGLVIFVLMFCLGGIYILTISERNTHELRRIAELHNIAVFRGDVLIGIMKVQNNIRLKGTRYAKEAEFHLDSVRMIKAAKKCIMCHHSPAIGKAIKDLENQIERYKEKTTLIFTTFPKSAVPEGQEAVALKLGDELIKNIEYMIVQTRVNLEDKEKTTLRMVNYRKNILLFILTVGPFFALGFAFILIKGLTKPVNSLLNATRRLKAGDLDYRVEGLKDEFGELAESFNEMADSLKGQMQEMQRTEQLKACGEMATGLAHEIRNPLAGIKLSIELLLAELDRGEKDREVLSKIIAQIKHVELLMKNLLNYARPAAAQFMTVDVNDILGKTAYFAEKHPSFSSGNSRKRIIKELAGNLPQTVLDPQQLQQVFLNLFLNAADATLEGGTITIKTSYDTVGETIVIDLKDTGKGIPLELKERIFQPFFTTKRKGTGLGLAVSKRLIEDNGGSIMVMNNAAGGATFRIILPVKREDKGVLT